MAATFIRVLNKRSNSKIDAKTSKLLVLDAKYRSYFSQANDKFGLSLRTSWNGLWFYSNL